ncbi:MAG TPA: hypothetical protein VHN37_00090, partial [Actinomycetota bacterium]|nr:hypothetical protein [Actinomycetota bacterium]
FVAPADAKKKKKPKTPPPPPACAPFAPGDLGKDAQTTVVTDAATAEAPVVVDLTTAPGLGNDLGAPGIVGQSSVYDETSSVFQNIQVDTANPSAGLYAKVEFEDRHDYDLYLLYQDGATAANSGDFNVAPNEGLGGGSPEGAWEAGTNYESVLGINTADCAGYTAEIVSYLTTGGAVKLSVWLGDAIAEPEPPA